MTAFTQFAQNFQLYGDPVVILTPLGVLFVLGTIAWINKLFN